MRVASAAQLTAKHDSLFDLERVQTGQDLSRLVMRPDCRYPSGRKTRRFPEPIQPGWSLHT